MNENKQIEEMIKVIVNREKYHVSGYTTCKMCDLKKCDLHCSKYSDIEYDCKVLYEAGYRKQSDTAKEFAQKLKSDFDNDKGNLYVISEERIQELAQEYGVKNYRKITMDVGCTLSEAHHILQSYKNNGVDACTEFNGKVMTSDMTFSDMVKKTKEGVRMTDTKQKLIELIKQNGIYNGSSMGTEYYVVKPEWLAEVILKNGFREISENTTDKTEDEQ